MMTYRHGFTGSCPFGHDAGRPDDGGYRNIFGPPGADETYDGLGPGREAETEAMLLRLARHVADMPADKRVAEGNSNIPAGYTYFAQFVAHDMVQTVAQPGLGGVRNFRQHGLVLDVLYGGGPAVAPHCYAAPPRGDARVKLRVGAVRAPSLRAGSAILQKSGDLPRATPAVFNDDSNRILPDVLIADPRNDDNVILAQLTALFHLLHNKVYDEVWAKRGELLPRDADEVQGFALTRAVVTLTYRRIVVRDLLRRLLCTPVFSHYFVGCPSDALLDQSQDDRIPVEFSHAVFRVGHAMVRPLYDLNTELPKVTLHSLLVRVSAQESRQLPLPENWIIDWRAFFGPSATNLSRPIGPSITSLLGSANSVLLGGRPGGLMHADLMRGVEGRVRRVAPLIGRLPPFVRALLGRLADQAGRATAVREWAAAGKGLEPADLEWIAEDPPLLLFILLEAQQIEDGKSLGPLGSVVVAETFARQLKRSAAMFDQPALDRAADRIFRSAPPYDMAALTRFVLGPGDPLTTKEKEEVQ